MGRVWLFGVAAALLLSGTGCQTYCSVCEAADCPELACDQDVDCESSEVCVDGLCFELCDASSLACLGGRVCARGLCVDPPACDADADCPPYLGCQAGVCRPRTCEQTADCPASCDFDYLGLPDCLSGLCVYQRYRACVERGEICVGDACVPPP